MYEYAFIHAEQKCGCWSRLLRTMTSLFHYYFLINATIQHQKLHVLLLSNCLNTKHSDIWRHCYRGIPPGVELDLNMLVFPSCFPVVILFLILSVKAF